MRLVIDTNVLVSAALKETSWPGMVIRWIDRFDGLLKTSSMEQEVFDVISRPRIAQRVRPLFAEKPRQIFALAESVPISDTVIGCVDPKDDKFLELAVEGHADLIVSGDHYLLALDPFQGIPIMTPAVFCRAQAL